MVYSTCSVLEAENIENVEFIKSKFEFMEGQGIVQYNPFNQENHNLNGLAMIENENLLLDTIGFFAAKFIKNRINTI